jgi:hypothetical protein
VLAAEEPSAIRGGALLGGRGGPLNNFVGDMTKYVLAKATCPVILTAPAAKSPAPKDGAQEPDGAISSVVDPGNGDRAHGPRTTRLRRRRRAHDPPVSE